MADINLKDFISDVITQITDGIIEAQKTNKEKGCIVNPSNIQTLGTPDSITYRIGSTGSNDGTVSILNFDLVIDVKEKTDKSGGLKVGAAVVGIEGAAKKEISNSQNNKLNFSIPVLFPISD